MTRGPTSRVTTSSASPLVRRRLFFQPRYSITSTIRLVGEGKTTGGRHGTMPASRREPSRSGWERSQFGPLARRARTPSRQVVIAPRAIAPRSKPAGAGTGCVGVSGPFDGGLEMVVVVMGGSPDG